MSNTLDFAETRNAYSDQPFPADSGKGIYLQIARLGSVDFVQENWPRIARHGVSESLEPESKSARFDLNADSPKTPIINEVQDSSDFDVIVKFIETNERESVVSVFRGLKNKPHSAEALRAFTKCFTEELDQKSTLDEVPSRETQCEPFVRRAQRLDEQGRTDAALDLIYDSIDEMLRNGQFFELDSLLERLPTNDLSADMLLGVLTASLPARSRLSHRRAFFCDVEVSIKDRGEFEVGLLTGLE